jgi:hypothetical protein
MLNYDDYLEQTKNRLKITDSDLALKPNKFSYAAYKNGESKIFPTMREAKSYSDNVETIRDETVKVFNAKIFKKIDEIYSETDKLIVEDLCLEYKTVNKEIIEFLMGEAPEFNCSSSKGGWLETTERLIELVEVVMEKLQRGDQSCTHPQK